MAKRPIPASILAWFGNALFPVTSSSKASDLVAQELSDEPLAQCVIDVLPDGKVRIRSTCMGRFDSSYAPLDDHRAPQEVQRLLGELRERLSLPPSTEVTHG